MEKRASPKNRKSGKKPLDKAKGNSGIREAGAGAFLVPSNTHFKDVLLRVQKDVLFRLKKGSDYVIVANASPTDAEVIDDISIEIIPRQTVSHQEGTLSDSALDPIIGRATEIIGDRKEAMRWLGTPVRGLDFATPISLMATVDGQMRVNDILGQMEHGIW